MFKQQTRSEFRHLIELHLQYTSGRTYNRQQQQQQRTTDDCTHFSLLTCTLYLVQQYRYSYSFVCFIAAPKRFGLLCVISYCCTTDIHTYCKVTHTLDRHRRRTTRHHVKFEDGLIVSCSTQLTAQQQQLCDGPRSCLRDIA